MTHCQLAGHVLQLGQGDVQPVLPMRGFGQAPFWVRQRAQQPQNRQHLLCDLGQTLAFMNGYRNPAAPVQTHTYPLPVLAPALALLLLLQMVHLSFELDAPLPRQLHLPPHFLKLPTRLRARQQHGFIERQHKRTGLKLEKIPVSTSKALKYQAGGKMMQTVLPSPRRVPVCGVCPAAGRS